MKVRSNIHTYQKKIRSILLTSGKVAFGLISTTRNRTDNHCHLVYLSERSTCYVREKNKNQPLGFIMYQYYVNQYIRDNILQIQWLLIQHMVYVHTKRLNHATCGHLYFDIYSFTN